MSLFPIQKQMCAVDLDTCKNQDDKNKQIMFMLLLFPLVVYPQYYIRIVINMDKEMLMHKHQEIKTSNEENSSN